MALSFEWSNIGEFKNENDCWYTYRETKNPFATVFGLKHEIDMSDGSVRFGNVLKTVVHVSVDEDEYGRPVIEKWQLKTHNVYTRND